jgi:hypothetical protein
MHNRNPYRRVLQNRQPVVPKPQHYAITRLTSLPPFICLSVLAGVLLLIGSTTKAQDSSDQQGQLSSKQSGFLTDYSKLGPDPKNANLLVYRKNPDVLKNSHKFILNPAIVYLLPEAAQRGIDPEQLEKLTRTLTDAIHDELTKSGHYEVVTNPGPGVMELRVAITNLVPTGGMKNAAVKGAATAASIAVAPGASLLVPRFSVGKVAIEGEVVDSVSGEVQGAFMDSKSGRRFFSGLKTYQSWGDINAAFRSWAKSFRQELDEMHES